MVLDFKGCIAQKKLVKIRPDKDIALSELSEAKKDLESAKIDFKFGNWKWATDKAYYSMFHAAKALLALKGYKEKSHVCLIIAIKELFVKEGILNPKFVDFLISGKKRREEAIYESKYSEEIAKTHLEAANEFLSKAKEIIKSG